MVVSATEAVDTRICLNAIDAEFCWRTINGSNYRTPGTNTYSRLEIPNAANQAPLTKQHVNRFRITSGRYGAPETEAIRNEPFFKFDVVDVTRRWHVIRIYTVNFYLCERLCVLLIFANLLLQLVL